MLTVARGLHGKALPIRKSRRVTRVSVSSSISKMVRK